MWDIKKKKIREISYNFTVISEGFFPFRDKKFWPDLQEKIPVFFYPSLESFLDRDEWERFDFSKEEEADILKRKIFLPHTPPVVPPPPPAPIGIGGGGGAGVFS